MRISLKNIKLLLVGSVLMIQLVVAMRKNLATGALTSYDSTEFMDTLTSMFYHVENTRKCGDNLQTFKVDLRSLWSKKFQTQIDKTFSLANSLNHLISNVEKDTKNTKKENVHIVESNLLPALSYFLFTQTSNSNKPEPFGQIEYEPNKPMLKFYDPYMIGFGVLLFYDMDDNVSSSKRTKRTLKCSYLYTKSNMTDEIDANNLIRNETCLAMNSTDNEDKEHKKNPNFSIYLEDNSSDNSKKDEIYINCKSW